MVLSKKSPMCSPNYIDTVNKTTLMTYRKVPHKKGRFIGHNGDLFSIDLATHKQQDKATLDPMMLEIL